MKPSLRRTEPIVTRAAGDFTGHEADSLLEATRRPEPRPLGRAPAGLPGRPSGSALNVMEPGVSASERYGLRVPCCLGWAADADPRRYRGAIDSCMHSPLNIGEND